MNYSENEVAPLYNEDFTTYLVGNLGSGDARIDVLTIVHHAISFDEAEKNKQVFEITDTVFMNIVPYDFLKEIKLRSTRQKDLYDIAPLEEIRNKK